MRTAPFPRNRQFRAIAIASPDADQARRVALVRWLAVLTALALLAAVAAPARAAIHDNAGIFSDQAEQTAAETIKQIRQKFKADLLIETYPSVPADKQAELQRKGNSFFVDWAIERAKAEGINGVAVLVVMSPGRLQAVVGNDTQKSLFTIADRDELTTKGGLPSKALSEKKYDEFLARTATFVLNRMQENAQKSGAAAPAARGGGGGSPAGGTGPGSNLPRPSCGFGGGIGGFLCLAVGGLVVFMIIRGVMNRSRAGYGPGGVGGPGYGQPGYGQPGYGPGGGGGGFGSGLLGGLLGGAVGGYAANKIFGHNNPTGGAPPADAGGGSDFAGGGAGPVDTSFSGSGTDFDSGGGGGGGDFGGGGSDFGGGGDSGGGSDF